MNRVSEETSANILVVDDDSHNLRLLTEALTRQGYEVRPIPNGNMALAAVQAEAPDLILLDIMMPDKDGFQVCAELKGDENTRDIPVIFLTALSEAFDKVRAFSLGVSDYITKPFQIEEVIVRIEHNLKLFWLQRKLVIQNDRLQKEIKERKLMEEKLLSSQAEIRGFFEAMADIVMMVDADGNTLKIAPTNPEQLYGNDTDIIGKTVEQFFGSSGEKFREKIREALETQEVGNCEYSLMLGERRVWFSASIAPTSKNTIAWVARDISDRKVLEQEIAVREARLNGFFNSAAVGMNIVDRELRFIQINDILAEINGLPAPEHIGKSIREVVPEIAPVVEPLYHQVLRTGKPLINHEISGEVHSQPGVMRYWVVSYFPIFQGNEAPSSVGSVLLEITDRKRAELELRLAKERLQYLLAASPAVIFSCKPSENCPVTFMSENVKEVLGYEAREFLENPSFWKGKIYPKDLEKTHLNGEGITEDMMGYEYRLQHKKGYYCWVYSELKLLRDERGNPLEWVGYLIDISVRKAAETALRDSEERFNLAVSGTNDGIWDWDLKTNRVYYSPVLVQILGYEEGELPANFSTWSERIHPDDWLVTLAVLEEHRHSRSSTFQHIHRLKHKQGHWLWVEVKGKYLEDRAGEPYRAIGTLTDITARKQAEDALRESAQREKALSAVIQKMRKSLDIDEIFAATTSELRQVINCDRVLIYQFNSDWSGEFVAESVGEEWKPLLYGAPLSNTIIAPQQCPVKSLTPANAYLRDTYLQETKGGVYNRGVNYLAVADIYREEFADCYIEMLEMMQAKAYIIVPIFRGDRLWGLLASYQNKSAREWKPAEISMVMQIGNQLSIALQQAKLLEQTKKQSHALQKAVQSADSANRAKSEFLANMSHELRTPLNAILGFAQIMNTSQSVSVEHHKNLTIINRAGEHLLALINDVLDLSKIEAGRMTFNQSEFDLLQLLDSLEKMLQLKAASKGLELIFDYGEGLVQYIKTDEGKLRQVLLNLLGNAIKFTAAGRVTLRVWVNSDKQTPPAAGSEERTISIHFEIEDTGPGISPEELKLLFEAFGQTETGRKSQEGTGLGLPISQKYVQLMGGEIQVTSTLGQGSIFAFDIQFQLGEGEKNPREKKPSSSIRGLATNQPEYRILVVDDNSESRLLLRQIFTGIGFAVCEAENGKEAVQKWQEWLPHLILMDMRMPVMDGYEATRQIRRRERQLSPDSAMPKTIIVALTASAFIERRDKILNAGCDDFIGKPFQVPELLETIGKYLGVEYEREADTPGTEATSNGPQTLSSAEAIAQLSAQPPEWIEKLQQAVCQCSDELVLECLEELPAQQAPLATTIANLAENFEFHKILYLIEGKAL
ncbi:response regulator [Phormidium sp. CCY1219]|uniref:response regulator n=1 Tax=Phormidium sp. CCY1219 TaxID=2886104 RepID=UPI002D1F1D5F|nr:response regulator [Phormidium sp. CCY1219]MEB3830361.1 response regulator [Phormidium sp. CCY1219]